MSAFKKALLDFLPVAGVNVSADTALYSNYLSLAEAQREAEPEKPDAATYTDKMQVPLSSRVLRVL